MRALDRPLAFIDTETTGLDPEIHEIIEVGIIKDMPMSESDPQKRAVSERFSAIVKPRNMAVADPAAMLVNGITQEELDSEEAIPFKDLAEPLNEILKDCIIVGKNVAFDLAFLQSGYKRTRREDGEDLFIEFGKAHVDIMSLAYAHLAPLGIKSLSLKSICEFLGVENENAHRALGDAAATRACFYQLINWTPLLDEEIKLIEEAVESRIIHVKVAGFGELTRAEAKAAIAYEILRDPEGATYGLLKDSESIDEFGGGDSLAMKWRQVLMLLRS